MNPRLRPVIPASENQAPPARLAFLRSTLFLLTATIPLACTLHQPITQLSKPALPSSYKAPTESITNSYPLSSSWWESYNDPTLNDLQTQALHSNFNLEKALASLEESRATLRMAKADSYPSIVYSGSFDRTRTSPNGSQNLANRLPQSIPFPATRNRFRTSFDTSYEIDLWGKIKNSQNAANAQFQSRNASVEVLALSISADLTHTYFTLRSLDLEKNILENLLNLHRQALTFHQDRYQAGLVLDADVTRAESEVLRVESDLSEIQRRRALTENALAILCGEIPSHFRLPPKSTQLPSPLSIPPGLPSELLGRRPDLIEAEQLAIAASSSIGVAKANFLPSIRLTGFGGYESVELKDLFLWESRAWSFGPSVSLPIFQGGHNRANLEIAQARYEQTVSEYRQRALIAFQEVEDALTNYEEYSKQAEILRRTVTFNEKTASTFQQRMSAGLSDFLDGVESQQAWLQARRNEIQVNLLVYGSQIQLIKALGGGFE